MKYSRGENKMATSISIIAAALFFLYFLRMDWLAYHRFAATAPARTPRLYCILVECGAIVILILLALADLMGKVTGLS
jgi:hypothetical protein